MPRNRRMSQASKWALLRSFFLPLCLLLSLGPAVGAQQNEDPGASVELELQALLDQLVDSVERRDDAGVDEVTCLDDLLDAQLEREQALKLIPDAHDPLLVEQRKSEVRGAAYAFVERLLLEGRRIELTDVSRVEVFASEDKVEETVVSHDGEELPITAQGVLGVKMFTLERWVDVDVCRLRGRWCLNPLSMQ